MFGHDSANGIRGKHVRSATASSVRRDHIAGLIAIISSERRRAVSPSQVDTLAAAYEALRGQGRRSLASAGEYARIVKIGSPADPEARIDFAGSSWAAAVGCRTGSSGAIDTGRLDGQFALISYDERSDEVSVVTDPFGMQSVYVAERGGTTYVSTSVLALASYLRAPPSPLGLYAFLRSGYHFGSFTSWEGISRLDPGTLLRFDRSRGRLESYWRPAVDRQVAKLGFRAAVDHCLEVAAGDLQTPVEDLSPAWSDLTAGFDSRLLNLLLDRAGVPFRTNTVGRSDDVDVRIAQEVARTAQWGWTRFARSSPDSIAGAPAELRSALAWGDGNLEVLQLAPVLRVHREQRKSFPTLFSGGGGEHFRSYAWDQEFLKAGRSTHVNFDNWIDMRMLGPIDTSIFRRDPTPAVRDDFRARMSAWSAPLSDELNTTQLDAMYAYKSTGHFGAYHSATAGSLISQLPFYRRPTFTAAHSVNFRHRTRHRLMRHMIERLDPRIAAIRTEPGGPAAPWRASNLHRFLPYYRRIARKAVRKTAPRTLPGLVSGPAGGPDHPGAAMRRGALDLLTEGGTHAVERSAPLYNRPVLERLLADAPRADFQHGALIGRVLTVELALRETDSAVDQWEIR